MYEVYLSLKDREHGNTKEAWDIILACSNGPEEKKGCTYDRQSDEINRNGQVGFGFDSEEKGRDFAKRIIDHGGLRIFNIR